MCSLLYNVLLLFVKLRRIGLLKSIPCCLILSFVVKCTLLVFNQAQLVLSICHPCTLIGRQFLSSIHKDWQTNLSPYFVLLIAGIFVIFFWPGAHFFIKTILWFKKVFSYSTFTFLHLLWANNLSSMYYLLASQFVFLFNFFLATIFRFSDSPHHNGQVPRVTKYMS